MSTRLSRYCDGLMEAAWLAAVILVPIFFNVYSSRIFEPDKLVLLRSLALLILAAWITKIVEDGKLRWERLDPGESVIKTIITMPLIAPVIALASVYVISTIFSVTPRTSLLGSYQRLQGLYTTLSYLVIFASIIGNLRKRFQVERLITAVIISSLPISLYGILQHYKIDPVAWAGDTSTRIASNMGNSIFVAAYLIMVFPLTVGMIINSIEAILHNQERLLSHSIRLMIYFFLGLVQLIALYMSGSRGPTLGLLAGAFFLFLLLSWYWRKRWLTIAIMLLTLITIVFLGVFNLPDSSLKSLRKSPVIGRFSLLLDEQSTSALVRRYIWEGAVKLITPHAPLIFPDGKKDVFNIIRPLIGYGPESMYVAYNPFYVPELGQVEKRNASPDRSHNETWDSLVIAGGLGLIVYITLFISVFYYGLKWIGLVSSTRQRNLLLALVLGGGVVGSVVLILWRGAEYFGLGLPLGVTGGIVTYVILAAIFGEQVALKSGGEALRSLTIAVLLSAIMAHFIEINFGIAIAVTRTYFWTFSALLLAVGYILPKHGEYPTVTNPDINNLNENLIKNGRKFDSKVSRGRKQRRSDRSTRSTEQGIPTWFRLSIFNGSLIGVILITLGYDLTNNLQHLTSAFLIMVRTLTRLPNHNNAVSYGILALVLTTWLGVGLLLTAEIETIGKGNWLKAFGVTLSVSGLAVIIYWFWHAGSLATMAVADQPTNKTANELLNGQVASIGSLLLNYYIYIFLMLLVMAFFLPVEWSNRSLYTSGFGQIVALAVLLIAVVLINFTNLRIIYADEAYKLADPYARNNQWAAATLLYQRALELAPSEDYYYLFLGRSYLEQAKAETDPTLQQQLVNQSESDLKTAQKINPLNTDHTANLGRLYSWWASRASEAKTRQELGQMASDYYAMAVTLSPNNSTLWGEWYILIIDVLHQPDEAYIRLAHALDIDPKYSWTQSLMGDYYVRQSRTISDTVMKKADLEQAVVHFTVAANVSRYFEVQTKLTSLLSLGDINTQLGYYAEAISNYQDAIDLNPKSTDVWKMEATIARLYVQLGDKANALIRANDALAVTPTAQQNGIKALIDQINKLP